MKSLVSVILLNSFVLSKNEYIGTVVRKSDEVYSQETFEHFSNSSWTQKKDNLKIKETAGEQGHVLEMDMKMTGDETGILETNVALPGDCDNVAILYISFKIFLSGYNHSLSSTFNDPNPDLKWSLTNLRIPDSPELTLTNLANLMASEGEWVSYKMEVHINMDSNYLLRLEMKAGMLSHQVLQFANSFQLHSLGGYNFNNNNVYQHNNVTCFERKHNHINCSKFKRDSD